MGHELEDHAHTRAHSPAWSTPQDVRVPCCCCFLLTINQPGPKGIALGDGGSSQAIEWMQVFLGATTQQQLWQRRTVTFHCPVSLQVLISSNKAQLWKLLGNTRRVALFHCCSVAQGGSMNGAYIGWLPGSWVPWEDIGPKHVILQVWGAHYGALSPDFCLPRGWGCLLYMTFVCEVFR